MINWYKNRVCLNVLAKDIQNAQDIYQATNGHVLIGILSSNYDSVESAINSIQLYQEKLHNNISIGLGAGNPLQWRMVAEISGILRPKHTNQVFSAVGYTRAKLDDSYTVNALVSPSGSPGLVKISTGPLSSLAEDAIIPIETAIAMIKEMGGNSVKYFPMKGTETRAEFIEVAKACAKAEIILKPTGGIDLRNFEEIVTLAKEFGVKHLIPHVYSSIIDKNGNTKIDDINILVKLIENLYRDC